MPLALAMAAQVESCGTQTKASQLETMPGWVGVGVAMPFLTEVNVVVLLVVGMGLSEDVDVDLVVGLG